MQCNWLTREQERDKKDKMHKTVMKYFILSLESIFSSLICLHLEYYKQIHHLCVIMYLLALIFVPVG